MLAYKCAIAGFVLSLVLFVARVKYAFYGAEMLQLPGLWAALALGFDLFSSNPMFFITMLIVNTAVYSIVIYGLVRLARGLRELRRKVFE